ncbi:MAG: DNA polymerase III subunit beta [Actinobacteria bacterium]|nr:DNA polymerase III subunit beta [Actinomycetota bacterium]
MKARIERTVFLEGVQITNRAISQRSLLPILSGILVESDKVLNLCATDLETTIITKIDAKVEKKGETVIPSRLIFDILRNLPEAAVELEFIPDKSKVVIRCQNSIFNLNTLPANDFPTPPSIIEKNKCSLKFSIFKETINSVIKAASTDETRPVLTGILISIGKDFLKMVTTDSYRLAIKGTKIKGGPKEEIKALVPAKVLSEIIRLPINDEENIEIVLGENLISFETKAAKVISRLIAGNFPDYEQLLTKDFKTDFLINTQEFEDIIRRISTLAKEDAPVKLSINKNGLLVSASTREVGDAEEKMKMKITKPPMDIAFNPKFLLDGISVIDEDESQLCFVDSLKPGIIKPKERDDYLYLIMPVRIT